MKHNKFWDTMNLHHVQVLGYSYYKTAKGYQVVEDLLGISDNPPIKFQELFKLVPTEGQAKRFSNN